LRVEPLHRSARHCRILQVSDQELIAPRRRQANKNCPSRTAVVVASRCMCRKCSRRLRSPSSTWRLGEISEKSRTQPSLQVQVSRVIPISTTFCPPPIEPILMTGKRRTGEDQRESVLRVGDVSNDTIDPGVGSRNEGLLGQADASIIEDPHAMVLVRRNYINCIHAVGRAVSPYLVLRPDGQQQCVLFAFCCSKDESGRTSVRPLSEIKTLRCSKRSSRFRFR